MNAPVEYEQTNPKWSGIMYSGTNNPRETIGTDGCGPTCAAMVVATLRNEKVTPENAAKWMMAHGGVSPNDGTYWSAIGNYLAEYNIPYTQTNSDILAREALKNNYMVITAMGKGQWTRGGHFILAYGLDANGKIKIHDPNSEATYRELGDPSKFFAERRQYWIIREAWMINLRKIKLTSKDTGKEVEVTAIKYNNENYVRLRDVPEIAPLKIGYENGKPTFDLVYK